MKNKKKIKLGIIGKNFGYNVIYKSFIKNDKYLIKTPHHNDEAFGFCDEIS